MNATEVKPVSRDAYGLLLLAVAAPSLVPGLGVLAAPLTGLGGILLETQLALGRRIPWMPARFRAGMNAAPLGPRLSLWIHDRLQPLLRLQAPGFPHVLAGLTVAWSSLLLLLPMVLVPFGNVVPALSLGLVGAGLVVRKSLLSWLGMGLSGGFTALLIVLGETQLLGFQAILPRLG